MVQIECIHMSEVVCLHSGLGSNSFNLKELRWLRGPVHESGNEREIDRWIGAASAVMRML